MIELTPQDCSFTARIREVLKDKSLGFRPIKVIKHHSLYTSGQRETMVYFIDRGQVKLLLASPEGKECLLAIRSSGDLFGELCLTGQPIRLETAVAMDDAQVIQIPHRAFIACLKNHGMLECLVQYLAVRISEQQEVIAALATVNSELRLGKTLLSLARRTGRSISGQTLISQRISHKELSEMVGTTRPRIGFFLKKFRALGLIQLDGRHCLVVSEDKLEDFIQKSGNNDGFERERDPNMSPGSPEPFPMRVLTSLPHKAQITQPTLPRPTGAGRINMRSDAGPDDGCC
jgi:CRP-like cAMP-binding protein